MVSSIMTRQKLKDMESATPSILGRRYQPESCGTVSTASESGKQSFDSMFFNKKQKIMQKSDSS